MGSCVLLREESQSSLALGRYWEKKWPTGCL